MSIERTPSGLCECGCGQRTSIAKKTDRAQGRIKGQPVRFALGHKRPTGDRHAEVFPGAVFGDLVVLREAGRANGHRLVVCSCSCGAVKIKRAAHLYEGAVTSCGCKMGRRWPPLEERLDEGIVRGGSDECWPWTKTLGRNGYGALRVGADLDFSVHRLAYEREHGPVPEGYHVHHRCGNKACCNPAHLEALTAGEHTTLHAKQRRAAA